MQTLFFFCNLSKSLKLHLLFFEYFYHNEEFHKQTLLLLSSKSISILAKDQIDPKYALSM